jgi:hypothetical protein
LAMIFHRSPMAEINFRMHQCTCKTSISTSAHRRNEQKRSNNGAPGRVPSRSNQGRRLPPLADICAAALDRGETFVLPEIGIIRPTGSKAGASLASPPPSASEINSEHRPRSVLFARKTSASHGEKNARNVAGIGDAQKHRQTIVAYSHG